MNMDDTKTMHHWTNKTQNDTFNFVASLALLAMATILDWENLNSEAWHLKFFSLIVMSDLTF